MLKIIKISSSWCPSCLIMNPRYKELIEQNNFELEEYDYDIDEEIVKKYNVGEILPVAIIVNDDKEITRIIGEKNKKELNKIIESINVK